MHATEDAGVIIEASGPGWVRYRADDGDVWTIFGECSRCGACETANREPWLVWDGPVGAPGACRDLRLPDRLDVPVRPEGPPSWPGCTLVGAYR